MIEADTIPGWAVLLVGVLLGQTGVVHGALSSWNVFMEAIIVPLYGLCVLLYLGKLFNDTYLSTANLKTAPGAIGSSKEPQTPPSVAAASETSTVLTPSESDGVGDGDGVVNMTGSYLLVSNVGFEAFLEVQGVPWALRRVANQARPVHQITHIGKTVTIQIKGVIESQTTYEIDGPAVETNVRGRIFRDQMRYLDSGDGIQVSKTAVTEKYDITVTRRLTPDRQRINMTSTAIFHDGRPPVESRQVFERIA